MTAPRPRRTGRFLRLAFTALVTVSALTLTGAWFDFTEALTHFQVVYAAAYALHLIVLAAARARAAFWRPGSVLALTLAGLLLHGLQVAWLWMPQSSPDLDAPQSLRLVWANLYYQNTDLAEARAFLEKSDADVIALCETTAASRQALSEIEARYPHALESRHDHLLLLSRLPLERRSATNVPGQRHVLEVDVVVGRRRAHLIVCHNTMPTYAPHGPILRRLGELAAEHEAAIVVGDLNVTNWSPRFRDLLARGDLRDGRRGRGIMASWHARSFPWLGFPIDHVLLRGPVRLASYELGPPIGSDHLPLLADIELGGKRGRTATVTE